MLMQPQLSYVETVNVYYTIFFLFRQYVEIDQSELAEAFGSFTLGALCKDRASLNKSFQQIKRKNCFIMLN